MNKNIIIIIIVITHLVAVGTVSGFCVCQRPVRLPMPGQVAGSAVTFTAIRTLTFLVVVVVVGRLLRSLLRSYRAMVVVVVDVDFSVVVDDHPIVFLQPQSTEHRIVWMFFSEN